MWASESCCVSEILFLSGVVFFSIASSETEALQLLSCLCDHRFVMLDSRKRLRRDVILCCHLSNKTCEVASFLPDDLQPAYLSALANDAENAPDYTNTESCDHMLIRRKGVLPSLHSQFGVCLSSFDFCFLPHSHVIIMKCDSHTRHFTEYGLAKAKQGLE